MLCRHCGTEIDTRITESDGSVICPGCGAVYKRKTSSIRSETEENRIREKHASHAAHMHPRHYGAEHEIRSTIAERSGRHSKTTRRGKPFAAVVLLIGLLVVSLLGGVSFVVLNRKNLKDQPVDYEHNAAAKNTGEYSLDRANETIPSFSASWCYFAVGEPEEVLFTAESSIAPSLFLENTKVGYMRDDGKEGDAIAGDGIYTYSLLATSDVQKIDKYYAGYDMPASDAVSLYYYDQPTEEEIHIFQDVQATLSEIDSQLKNHDGYISANDKKTALNAVKKYSEQLLSEGIISEYRMNEDNVFIRFSSGLTTMYIPRINGTLSNGEDILLSFITYEPYKKEFEPVMIDDIAYEITTELQNCTLYNRLDNDLVTLETIKKDFTPNKIILWYGHGAWDPVYNSVIITGEDNTHAFTLYLKDLITGRITTTLDRIAICSRFIDRYCGDMNHSMLYLNCCLSGKDEVLSNSFLNKGASLVICNTETIKANYAHSIQYRTLDEMRSINTSTGRYFTAGEALQLAKEEFGSNDIEHEGIGAETVIRGDQSFRLSNNTNGDLTEPPSETAHRLEMPDHSYLGIRYEPYVEQGNFNTIEIKSIQDTGEIIFDLSFYRFTYYDDIVGEMTDSGQVRFHTDRSLSGYLMFSDGTIILVVDDTPNFYSELSAVEVLGEKHVFYPEDSSNMDASADENDSTLIELTSDMQYSVNIFLSNFAEQAGFNNYDAASFDVNQLVDFAFLYCKINRRNERIGVFQENNPITGNTDYYFTVSLENVNETLKRHFGVQLSESDAGQFHGKANSKEYYKNGTFYFPATDGEAYNRIAIVKQAVTLYDGTIKMVFDVYALDPQEYRTYGITKNYYSMTADQAYTAQNFTHKASGTAIVRPYRYNGIDTFQLENYVLSVP